MHSFVVRVVVILVALLICFVVALLADSLRRYSISAARKNPSSCKPCRLPRVLKHVARIALYEQVLPTHAFMIAQ